ncbi:MAG: DUF3299 domain-containing protein [Verrucomicrobiales bacterium]
MIQLKAKHFAAAVLASMLVQLIAADGKSIPPGPRGKPIRPPQIARTNSAPAITNMATVITLPGGVTITNIPGEFLPRSTNTVRLPSVAARRFTRYGYHPTSFTELARFFIKTPESSQGDAHEAGWPAIRAQIPKDILNLDGKKVALAGFTLPITLVNGRATEFLLLRTQAACCFGMVPRLNEIVIVKMPAPGMTPELDVPMVVGGVLHLKWIGEPDQLTAIYELKADRVERATK